MSTFNKTLCQSNQTLPKSTLIAMFAEGSTTRLFLEGLKDSEWAVLSFNALTRQVCVILTPPSGMRTISLLLPELSAFGG